MGKSKPRPTKPAAPVEERPREKGGWRRFLIPLLLFLAGYASFAIPSEWFGR